jgi:hypothetical protein
MALENGIYDARCKAAAGGTARILTETRSKTGGTCDALCEAGAAYRRSGTWRKEIE